MATKAIPETISAAEAKSHFAEALRRAESGDVVVITRYGKPVAALISAGDLSDVRRRRSSSPRDGLAGLVGLWNDGDELADELDRVVAKRALSPPREIPDFDRP